MRRQRQTNGAKAPGHARTEVARVTMLLENNPYPQDVRVRDEARSLAAAGYTVEVIAPRGAGQRRREVIDGVHVKRFRSFAPTGHGLAALLLEYIVAFCALHTAALRSLWRGAGVLHLHNPPDYLFPAGVAYRLLGRHVVFDHHDLGPELVQAKFGGRALVALARLAERLTFRVATHVVAANASHADIACGRGRKSPSEVTVVRNGPPRGWTELPINCRHGALRSVHLVYVGAISEQDGADALPETIARLRALDPPIQAALTIVGDGDGRRHVEAAAERYGVADAVSITGWIEPDRVRAFIEDADICVDPAPSTPLNERSTMIKLAEYLALGKPVVAYDLLETRRTVGDAAVLVPSGDAGAFATAIAELAGDGSRRTELSAQARERSHALTWDHSAAALLRAYTALCPLPLDGSSALRPAEPEQPAQVSAVAES